MDYQDRAAEFSRKYLEQPELKLDFRGRAELSLLLVDNGFKPEWEHDPDTKYLRGVEQLRKGGLFGQHAQYTLVQLVNEEDSQSFLQTKEKLLQLNDDVEYAGKRKHAAHNEKERHWAKAGLSVMGGVVVGIIANKLGMRDYYSLATGLGTAATLLLGLNFLDNQICKRRETDYDVEVNIRDALQEQLKNNYQDKILVDQQALKYALGIVK